MEINLFYLSLKLELYLLYIRYVAQKEVNCIFPQGQEGQIPKITTAMQHVSTLKSKNMSPDQCESVWFRFLAF